MPKQTVFETNTYTYRIPALIYKSTSKTLLAFAEQRTSSNDENAEKLVMKTGEVKENSSGKTVEWSDLKVVDKAHTHGYRPMNPCPVYDEVRNKLFLFFIRVEDGITERKQIDNYENRTRLCYITSEDFGENWADPIDLTDKLAEIKRWATFAVGPGHGIQTQPKNDKYRLIVPVHAYYSWWGACCFPWGACCSPWGACCSPCCNSLCKPNQYAVSLYSDDSGETWTFGKMFETKSGECEMAEISENQIYCNARSTTSFRVETSSNDNGVNFSQDKSAEKLEEAGSGSGCQGSVISFPAGNASDQNSDKWLLFTHPTRPERRNLGMYLNKSPSDTNGWSKPWVINDGPSGYSDLAYIDGWFACLYECGKDKIHEQIAFEIFSYDDIKKHFPV